MGTYQIAEVAERTGFTPATLRYYEEIGLMAPAGRTAAGYRLYDDASLARLRFIARAKQIGCTLEEITDLATAWDGGECGPLQERLQAAVEAKITDAQSRIADLMTFTAELQQARAALRRHRPDGPCDDTCGCVAGASDLDSAPAASERPPTGSAAAASSWPAGSEGTSVALVAGGGVAGAGVDASALTPIACTLGAGAMEAQLGDWQAVLAEDPERVAGVTARLPLEDGIRLELGAGTDLGEVARLAAAEQGCCRFFGFALVIDHRGTALEVHAPPEAADVVTAVFGAPAVTTG